MNWFQKPTAEQKREARLLRQWQAACLKNRLEMLPVQMLARHLCRPSRSESLDTDSSSPSSLPRDKRSAANMSVCERLTNAKLFAPVNRLRSQVRSWWTHRKRRLASRGLALLVKLARWSLKVSSRG